ncbi:MAG TPA: hypothetical protein VKB77_10935 [Terriglobales bacterium]|nr:hypothetical protein [Terriglobales bacterium]
MRALESEPGERLLIEAARRDPARFAELYQNNFVIDPQARPRDLHVLRSLGLGLDGVAHHHS